MSQCCFFQCAVCGTVPSVPDPESRAPEAIDWLPLNLRLKAGGARIIARSRSHVDKELVISERPRPLALNSPSSERGDSEAP